MAPRYEKGQRVKIVPVKNQRSSARDSELEPYFGQSGTVTDFHWISAGLGIPGTFYIYTVRIGNNDIVVHEDELEPLID